MFSQEWLHVRLVGVFQIEIFDKSYSENREGQQFGEIFILLKTVIQYLIFNEFHASIIVFDSLLSVGKLKRRQF